MPEAIASPGLFKYEPVSKVCKDVRIFLIDRWLDAHGELDSGLPGTIRGLHDVFVLGITRTAR